MEAKKLYPVQVNCVIPQSYIEGAVKYVSSCLPSQLCDLNDIDEPMFDDRIRVCVDFEIASFDSIEIKAAELLNEDYDVLHLESAIFRSLLESVISDYNARHKEAVKQGYEILETEKY